MPEYKDKKQEQRRDNQQQSATPLQQKQQPFHFYKPPPITATNIQLKEIGRSTFKPATGKYAEQHQAMIQRFGLKRFNNQEQSTPPLQKKENKTGLPDNLKAGVENLSGMSMDDVKVHYNSPKPPQLQAHAYAQGTDIHLASGQEKHLPHEAWHVAQQKQGRVKPTTSMNGVNINDDKGLEREADVMGGKAMQMKAKEEPVQLVKKSNLGKITQLLTTGKAVIQRMTWTWDGSKWNPADPSSADWSQKPTWNGKKFGETHDDGTGGESDDDSTSLDYNSVETLSNGTVVNFPALTLVMNGVTIGAEVSPNVWRKMRQHLSNAITLPNKSHPAHGSNFNQNQRPEQQIKDWANPISGPLKDALYDYFSENYNVYL